MLIPIQASYFALEGTDDLLETIDKIKARANPQLQILGALITMYDKRTPLAKDIYEQIQRVFGVKVFETVITKSVRLEESPAYRESIFTFAPQVDGSLRVLPPFGGGPEPCLSPPASVGLPDARQDAPRHPLRRGARRPATRRRWGR